MRRAAAATLVTTLSPPPASLSHLLCTPNSRAFCSAFASSPAFVAPSSVILRMTSNSKDAPARATSASPSTVLPQEPLRYLRKKKPVLEDSTASTSPAPKPFFPDLSPLSAELERADKRREEAFASSRKLNVAIASARTAMEYEADADDDGDGGGRSEADAVRSLDVLVEEVLGGDDGGDYTAAASNAQREANLGYRVEDYVRLLAYRHFLSTGRLIRLSELNGGGGAVTVRDDEYLGGACMGLSHDLARYAVGRATARDSASVGLARDLSDAILVEMLKFDFRNGPLRKKYDGIKYALKKLETILYELSVTGNGGAATKGEGDDVEMTDRESPSSKRAKLADRDVNGVGGENVAATTNMSIDPASASVSSSQSETKPTTAPAPIVDEGEMEQIRLRLEHRDELRERLIKRCRDAQKSAKRAIFALHRGGNDAARSSKLLSECEHILTDELLPLAAEEPTLRTSGSLTSALEEYAEAKLFDIWLAEGRVAGPEELLKPPPSSPRWWSLSGEEYLGGLCDLTGEVGRVAVQRGTARDSDGVRSCLETNLTILAELQSMTAFPGKLFKKLDPLRRSVEKLEHVLYELSLVEAGRMAGGCAPSSSSDAAVGVPGGGDNPAGDG